MHALWDLLRWSAISSLRASVLALIVLLTATVGQRWLRPGWTYALWLLVFLALALPRVPASPFSIYNLLPPPVSAGILAPVEQAVVGGGQAAPAATIPSATRAAPEQPASAASETVVATTGTKPTLTKSPTPHFPTWETVLTALWLLGIALFGARLWVAEWRFRVKVWRAAPVTDPRVLGVWSEAIGVDRKGLPTLWQVDGLRSPVLFGVFRPRVLLPVGLADHLSDQALRHVLVHELVHQRRRDLLANWAATMLEVLHWFNPIVWWSFRRMTEAQEFACDAATVGHFAAESATDYGHTLVRVLELTRVRDLATPSVAGIMREGSLSRRRIQMISLFKKPTARWSALTGGAVVVAIGILALSLAHPSPSAASSPGSAPSSNDAPLLASVHMTDPTSGWGVSDNAIFHTNDGGQMWVPVLTTLGTASNPSPLTTGFVGQKNAWVAVPIGQTVTIYHTSDGGSTWLHTSITLPDQIRSTGTPTVLTFADALHGWMWVQTGHGSGLLYATSNGGQNWALVFSSTTSGTSGISNAEVSRLIFPDTSNGWLTTRPLSNAAPAMYRTQDAGRTWSPQNLPAGLADMQITGISPIYSTGGVSLFAVRGNEQGTSSIVILEDDHGAWTVGKAIRAHTLGFFISFVNSTDGMVADGQGVFATTDGGQTWMFSPAPLGNIQQLDFVSPTVGFAVRQVYQGGRFVTQLLHTSDAGHEWTVISLSLAGSSANTLTRTPSAAGTSWSGTALGTLYSSTASAQSAPPGSRASTPASSSTNQQSGPVLAGIVFTDSTQAWAIGGGRVWHSVDGGRTWGAQAQFPQTAAAVSFVTDNLGWVGAGDILYRTANGGKDWAPEYTASETILHVDFASSDSGWMITRKGAGTALWKTDDGGRTWTAVNPCDATGPANIMPSDLSFLSAQDGAVICPVWTPPFAGILKWTTTGGSTWTTVVHGVCGKTEGLDFTSRTNAVAWCAVGAGGGFIMHSADGGASWALAKGLPPNLGVVVGVSFYTPSDGFAAVVSAGLNPSPVVLSYTPDGAALPGSPHETFYTTSDGGADWSELGAVPSP